MSTIDYDALRGETGGDPPDGIHEVWLARAALVSTRKGPALVTEWQTVGDPPYYWSTWFGFEPNRMQFTQAFLDSVHIDRAKVTDDDAFEEELHRITGQQFRVRTKAGASWVNTDVLDANLLDDLPVDTSDLPAPQAPPTERAGVGVQGKLDDDNTIPF